MWPHFFPRENRLVLSLGYYAICNSVTHTNNCFLCSNPPKDTQVDNVDMDKPDDVVKKKAEDEQDVKPVKAKIKLDTPRKGLCTEKNLLYSMFEHLEGFLDLNKGRKKPRWETVEELAKQFKHGHGRSFSLRKYSEIKAVSPALFCDRWERIKGQWALTIGAANYNRCRRRTNFLAGLQEMGKLNGGLIEAKIKHAKPAE